MATKTFKIGEYSASGIITAEVKENKVTVIFKEWDYSQGTKRSSKQTKAKELNRIEVDSTSNYAHRTLFMALTDDTTYYYADTVLQWIKTHVKFNSEW
jgi:hypothetical protein